MIEFWHNGTLTLQEADQAIADLDERDLTRLAEHAVDGVKWDQLTDQERKAQRARNALAGRQLAAQRLAQKEAHAARSNKFHQAEAERAARLGDLPARKRAEYQL